jgi:hypothetical protein
MVVERLEGPSAHRGCPGPAPAPRLVERVAAPVKRRAYRLRVDDVQIELDSTVDEAVLTQVPRAVRAC